MNNLSNSTFIFEVTESFLLKIGSTWTLDSFYLFVIGPFGLVGFVLNLICFAVLCQIQIAQTKLYKYLRVYSINSSLMCLILSFSFFGFSPRYFGFFREPIGIWFRCQVFAYGFFSVYLFNNLLDILIVLLRLAIFMPKLKFLEETRPYILSI